MMWGWGAYGGYGAPWGLVGSSMMMIFGVAIVVGVVFLIRHFIRQERHAGKEDSALEILRKRFANGEIGKEEYDEKRNNLA
jgi:putative membrane protein